MGDLGSQEWELCSNVLSWRQRKHGLEKHPAPESSGGSSVETGALPGSLGRGGSGGSVCPADKLGTGGH